MTKKLIALLLAFTTTAVFASCSGDDGGNGDASDIPDAEDFNQADVDFATSMIPHHAQALAMVDLTRERDLSRPVQRLAEAILVAQGPEIETMVDWLTAWDQPVPETVRDHVNAHGDGEMEMDADMPGMMTAEELEDLENSPDSEFESLWLEMMIEHHEGAIAMAQTEQSEGEYADAVSLAETIASTQQNEIELMEGLLPS